MNEDIQKRALQWISGRGVGRSSKSIWSVMMGVESTDMDTPHDGDDFSRCYKLLKLIPEWQERMPEVAKACPKWTPLIPKWDEMMEAWHKGHTNRVHRWLRDSYDECMRAAGYEQTGPGGWRKGESCSTTIKGKDMSITFSC